MKFIEKESKMVAASDWGEGRMGICFLIRMEFPLEEMKKNISGGGWW